MKYLLLLLLGCKELQQSAPIEPTKSALDIVNASDPSKYPETPHWNDDYDAIILATLKEYPVKKMPCSPLVTIAGIVKAESGFKKSSTYHEPPPLGIDSIGLLQMSVEDENWAKCGFKSVADVKNPIRNLYCGIKTMNRYEQKWPEKNFYQAQGAYWAVVRRAEYWPGKPQGGWKTVRAYWEKQGCKIQ